MKNSQRGFIVPLLIMIIAVLVIAGGVYIYQKNKESVQPISDSVATIASTTNTTNQVTSDNTIDPDTQTCLQNAQTNLDSSACVGAQFDKDDQQLNQVYNTLLATINNHLLKNDYPLTNDPNGLQDFKNSLIKAEKEWVSYRDDMCASITGIDTLNGSEGQVDYPLCQSQLTREQIVKLNTVSANWFSQ